MKKIIFLSFFFLTTLQVTSQDCDSNYFSVRYNAKYSTNFFRSVSTSKGDMIAIGNLLAPRGWITKISAQGNVLWSNEYNAGYYANGEKYFSNLRLTDIIPAYDSTYFVVGSLSRDGEFIGGLSVPPQVSCGVLMNLDRYGNAIWSRMFISAFSIASAGPGLSFSNVIKLNNGDYAAALQQKDGPRSFSQIICFAKDGSVKWTNYIDVGAFDLSNGKRGLLQARNGNIVVADVVSKRSGTNGGSTAEQHFHFYALDPNTGARAWESSYEFPAGNSPEIAHMTELPDGKVSVLVSALEVSSSLQPPFTKKGINIIIGNTGDVQQTLSYYPANGTGEIIDAHDTGIPGHQLFLMKDGNGKAILAEIDAGGKIIWTQGYGNASSGLPPSCFNSSSKGYDIFFSQPIKDAPSRQSQVLITDPSGAIDCATTDVQLVEANAFWSSNSYAVNMNTDQAGGGPFAVYSIVITADKFPLDMNMDCQKNIPCCHDVIDTLHTTYISLCNGSSYQLPDHSVVTYGGNYDVTLTTAKGCDSTVFYNIKVYKDPAELMSIPDTCFAGRDSLVLSATPGFERYAWMNTLSENPSFTIHEPGTYSVRVSNFCGEKTETVRVYDQCDFPVFMPNAFTPNNDGLNDLFKVPDQNRNRLVLLQVFNRWGQVIFSSSDIGRGWDGTFKKIPQASDVYIYRLVMKGLMGKEASQKGTVTLIR